MSFAERFNSTHCLNRLQHLDSLLNNMGADKLSKWVSMSETSYGDWWGWAEARVSSRRGARARPPCILCKYYKPSISVTIRRVIDNGCFNWASYLLFTKCEHNPIFHSLPMPCHLFIKNCEIKLIMMMIKRNTYSASYLATQIFKKIWIKKNDVQKATSWHTEEHTSDKSSPAA